MPKGTQYQDVALTNVAVGYKNTDLIADQIFPTISVPKQSGKIYKFSKEAFRLLDDVRAPGTVSNRVKSYSVSSDTYFCDNHAMHDVVPNEDKVNADAVIQPEVSMTEGLTDLMMLRREYKLAAYLFNTTTFAGRYTARTGTARWNDYTNSDPIADADTAKENVRKASGAKANAAIMGAAVYNKLKRHPQLLDMFKYTAGGVLTQQQVAEALGIDRLLVGNAIYVSSAEGAATETTADVWGKYCLFAYIAKVPEIRRPSLGYGYTWQTGVGGYQVNREELGPSQGHGTFIEVMKYFDDIVHSTDFGYLWSTIID
jgi:hypothetical protein